MNTNFIKYIIMIHQEGNVTRAAKALFMSQQALFKTLNNIEMTLGISLFIREKRKMRLTDAGKIFIKEGEKILVQEEYMLQQISHLAKANSATLKLGIPGERGASLLPVIIPAFKKLYPNIRLEITENYSSNLEDLLLKGSIDLALHTLPINQNVFDYETLADDCIVIGASRKSAFANLFNLKNNSIQTPYLIPPKLLRDYEFLLVKDGRGTRRIADNIFINHNIKPQIYQEFDRHQTLVKMCSVGEQLCITPCITPINLHIDKKMCFFTLESPVVNRHVIVSYLKSRTLSPAEKDLILIARDAAQTAHYSASHITAIAPQYRSGQCP